MTSKKWRTVLSNLKFVYSTLVQGCALIRVVVIFTHCDRLHMETLYYIILCKCHEDGKVRVGSFYV